MMLRNTNVVITGASQGLGKEIAAQCIDAGASVLLAARNAALLEATRAELAARAAPDQAVLAHAADVSSPEEVTNLFQAADARLGTIEDAPGSYVKAKA